MALKVSKDETNTVNKELILKTELGKAIDFNFEFTFL